MRASMVAAALAAGVAAAAQVQPDPDSSRALAAACFTCHGTEGRSVGGIPPSLAGRDRNYLLQQLREFKAGSRPATIMHQQARGYTDEQLASIASYFSAVKAAAPEAAPAARGSN